MRKLVFNFHNFHFWLLITAFVFIAMPAMATIEISLSGTFTDDDTNSPENERQLVVTLTYSVEPDPKPTITDLTLDPNTSVTFSEGTDGDSKTYFITWSNLPVLTADAFVNFTLAGYNTVFIRAHDAPPVTFFRVDRRETDNPNFDPSQPPNPPNVPVFVEELVVDISKITGNPDTHLPGSGYAIIVADTTAALPTLPTNSPPYAIVKVAWSDVSDESVPNLWTLFQGGGTLNLRVNIPSTTHRLGSLTDASDPTTADDNHNRNQRQVVINEVMWAQDESHIGDAASIAQEQWIEIYNRTTSPIAYSDIKLITSKDFPGPPAETDRLSNVPEYDITWDIDSKGQHGSSATPRREFKSMQRVNYANGWEAAHWSIATIAFLRNYRGTPGKPNRAATVPTARTRPSQDTPAKDKIIINEIGNLSDDALDWIELRNVTGSDQSLKDWALTKTTGFGNETEIVQFPAISIPARSVLLLVNKNPSSTPLSMGFDVEMDAADQEFGAGTHQFLAVEDNKLAIPNNNQWLLILRSGKPWDVGDGRDVYQTGHRVEDAVGPGALHNEFVKRDLRSGSPNYEKKPDGKSGGDIWHTKIFPLNGNLQADADFLQSDRLNSAGKVWVRDGAKQGYLKDAWSQAAFTGIGYDRSVRANDRHGGTPGYDNSVAKGKLSQLDGGSLIITELMLATGNKSLPQWIELHNTSKTRAIDLAADSSEEIEDQTGWQLIIENHESGSWKEFKRNLNIAINLKDLFTYIPPNQTVLIVSTKGKNSERDYFPDTRVAGIFEKAKAAFSMANKKDAILNAEGGFYIRIVDGDGTVSDEIGNLDGQAPNLRQGIGLDDPYSWNWPTELTEDEHRTSLLRLKDANGRPRIGVPNRNIEGDLTGAVLPMGMKSRPAKYAWVHAVDTAFKRVPREELWYGDSKDIGTPGFVKGTPLPVNLSFFRPALENGAVVIRWTTESELDNAGFNIYRSRTRNGEFKQINANLIQGAGTTGERQTYKWIDTTAKQGVIYYYQIEDVSFAGERQVLTTTHLKGFVSARNRLTTTWSELKSSR